MGVNVNNNSKIKKTGQNKQSFIYGSTILMASMIIVKLLGAVFKVPLTSVIHEIGMTYFTSAYNIYTVVYALTVTGLSASIARMVAENATMGRYRDVKKLLKVAVMVFVPLGIIGSIIIFANARGFSELIKSPNSLWAIRMISPAILFCCLMASYRGYYEGLSDMYPTAVTQVIEVVVKMASGLLFAFLVISAANKQFEASKTVFGVAVASAEEASTVAIPFAAAGAIIGVSLSTLFGFIYVFVRYRVKGDYITPEMLKNSPEPRKTRVLLYRLVKISIPITLGAVVIQLSVLIDTVTIMNRLKSCFEAAPEALLWRYGDFLAENEEMHEFLNGCFVSTVTLFNLVPAFTNIFGKSGLPNVTSAWTTKNPETIKKSIEAVIRVTMLVAAPMAMGLSFMSKPILNLLFPSRAGLIEVGAPLLSILGLGALCLSLVTPLNAIFQGINRMDLPVKIMAVGALIKLTLNWILIGIPQINILGGSFSTLACYLTIAMLSLTMLVKITKIDFNFKNILIYPLICGTICGFSAFLAYFALTRFKFSSIMALLSIAVGAVAYVVSIGIFNVLSKDDILMLPKGNKILKALEKLHIIR